MNHTFKTIHTESGDKKFKLFAEFNIDSFNIIVLEKNNAWKADITPSDITSSADNLNVQPEEYFSTLKQYLQCIPTNVDIQFNNKELICYYKENKIKLKYFSCKVKKIEFADCVYNLLDTFSSQNEQLKEQNSDLFKEVDILREDKNILADKLTQFVDKKKQDDQELFSNFVLVLNEKKRRIQHLTQTLQAFKAGRPVLNPQIKLTKKTNKVVKQENEISESEASNSDHNGYNTDEDSDKKRVECIDNVLPIKSYYDDLFSDTEDDVELPKRKKVEDNDFFPNMPSTSGCNNNEDNEPEIICEKMEDDSPKIHLDTQDLLDCF